MICCDKYQQKPEACKALLLSARCAQVSALKLLQGTEGFLRKDVASKQNGHSEFAWHICNSF